MIALNLLPPQIRRAQARAIIFEAWKRAMVVLAIGCILINAGLFAMAHMLQVRQQRVESDFTKLSQQVDNSDLGTIRRNITTLDDTLRSVSQIIPTDRNWAGEMSKLVQSLPAGVLVTQLDWTPAGSITLHGIAKLRSDFVDLDAALKANPNLTNVQTSSQASRRDTLPFEYTATWKSDI